MPPLTSLTRLAESAVARFGEIGIEIEMPPGDALGLFAAPAGNAFSLTGGGGGGPGRRPTRLWGHTEEEYRQAYETMRAMLPSERFERAIATGVAAGRIPSTDPSWMRHSPFGVHKPTMLFLADLIDPLFEREPTRDLNVVVLGPGLHDEVARIEREMAPESEGGGISGLDLDDFLASVGSGDGIPRPYRETLPRAREGALLKTVTAALRELYGGGGLFSYEPRELLSLLLGGDRRGTLRILDNDPLLPQNLGDPNFAVLNTWRYHYHFAADQADRVLGTYWDRIARGRETERRSFGPLTSPGEELVATSFRFADSEMGKMRHRWFDMATDPFAEDGYEVAVWFESHYLFPHPIAKRLLAQIVDHLPKDRYLVVDWPLSPQEQGLLGLEKVFGAGDERIFRKKGNSTPTVRQLAGLTV